MPSNASSLSRSVKNGLVWLAIERGGLQVLNLLSSVLLARLLTPSAFGVMGMSGFFTGMSRRLMNFGFSAAVIRRKEIRADHLSTLFVVTVAMNASICLALIAVSPFAGRYFGDPLVGDVLRWMSLVFVLRSIGVCPWVILRRRLDFKSTAYATFIDATVKVLVSVPLAWYGYGVWALVYAELAGSLADKLYLAWAARWVPSVRVTTQALKDLFTYGVNISIRSTIAYVSSNIDNFIVGKTLGMAALGFYEKSYNLMRLPVAELSGRLSGVLFPALARLQDDDGRFRAAFRKTLLGTSLVSFPVFMTLTVLAQPLVSVLFGPQWGPAVVPFQILCLSGPFRMSAQLVTNAIDACGKLGQDVRRRAFMLVVLVPAVVVASRWGIVGVALAVLATTVISYMLVARVASAVTPVRSADLLRPQLVPAAASLVLGAVQAVVLWLIGKEAWPPIVVLVVATPAGWLAYFCAIYLLRTPPIRALWEELRADARRPLLRLPLLRRWA